MSNPANPITAAECCAESAPAARSNWQKAKPVLRWSASAIIIGWLGIHTNWQNVWLAFASASVGWLFVTACLYVASQTASVARWKLLVRAVDLSDTFGRLFAAYFEGMFVNVCLPTTFGGDVMKVLRVGRSQNKRAAAATVMADRISGLAALFVLLAIGLALTFDESHGTYTAPLAINLFLVAVPAIAWLLRNTLLAIEASNGKQSSTATRTLSAISRRLPVGIKLLAARAPLTRVIAWAVAVQSLNVFAVWAAGRAIGLYVPVAGILVAATTVSLAAALPISIAGIGVREASLPLLLASYGVARESSVAIGLVWTGAVLIVGLLGGPFHFVLQREAQSTPEPIAPVARKSARRAA